MKHLKTPQQLKEATEKLNMSDVSDSISQKQKSISNLNRLIESDKKHIQNIKEHIKEYTNKLNDSILYIENNIKTRYDIIKITESIPDDDNFADNYWSNIEIENLRETL